MRITILVIAFILSISVLASLPVSCDTSKASRENYPAFSISVEIPAPHRDFDGGKTPGSLMDKGYESAGLAYDIVITPVAPEFRSRSALDEYLNKMLGLTNRMQQYIASRHPSERWSVSSRNNMQFTGLTVDDFIMEASFSRIIPDHKASVSIAIAALKSDYSQIALVSVVGPRGRRPEIEAAAKAMSQSVDKIGSGNTQASANQGLKPDQIELFGVVESIASDSRSLVMKADTVSTHGQANTHLDPPRQKTVLLNSLPTEIAVGSRIRVVGQNSGSGKPIRAETLSLAGL